MRDFGTYRSIAVSEWRTLRPAQAPDCSTDVLARLFLSSHGFGTFTAVTRVQIPSGTPTFSTELQASAPARPAPTDQFVTNVARFGLQTPASSTTRRELLIMNAAFLLSRLWSVMTSLITR
jgi:hypothetical protein